MAAHRNWVFTGFKYKAYVKDTCMHAEIHRISENVFHLVCQCFGERVVSEEQSFGNLQTLMEPP